MLRPTHLLLLSFCLFLFAVPARAVRLSLDSAPPYALRHNPSLAAARLRIEEARGRLLHTGRLSNPEIELEYLQNVRTPERSAGVALMQRFPLTARLRLEKSIGRAQLAAAEAEVRDIERKLAAETRAAAVKLVALRTQAELRQQQIRNSREQSEFINRRLATGEASAVDAAMVELETQMLAVEVIQIDTQRATLLGELRPLLGVEPGEAIEITGTMAAPVVTARGGANGEGRADLELAQHHAEAARQGVALARALKWQDIGVGLFGTGERMEDAPDGLTNDYFLGFRFSLALPIWNRNEGRIAEANAAAARAERETEALALTIRSEVETARAEMKILARLVAKMDGSLLPKATEIEDLIRNSYGTGQAPLTEVLRARTRRLDLSQRRVEALRDYHLARVRYEAAQGGAAARPSTQGGKNHP